MLVRASHITHNECCKFALGTDWDGSESELSTHLLSHSLLRLDLGQWANYLGRQSVYSHGSRDPSFSLGLVRIKVWTISI